jgi:dodecin
MSFARPAGDWRVTDFLRDDVFSAPISGTEITASFGEDGALSGSAGCNRYCSSYRPDEGRLEIDSPASTRMACATPDGILEQESAYLALLPTAVDYRIAGDSLELLGPLSRSHGSCDDGQEAVKSLIGSAGGKGKEEEAGMSVAKVIEITASSEKSFDDAVALGVAKAEETLRNVKGAWVSEQKVDVEGGRITSFRVTLRVTFVLD